MELPIDPFLPRIVAAVRERGGIVLVAEPGAGKTTRVPPALLAGGIAGDRGEIVVVQPRRLAARMAARRVAEELGEEVGGRVGYTVRFEDVSSPRTRIRFVTEGVLARRIAEEPELPGVAVAIFDELHERRLSADVSLALARRLRASTGPDLSIVAMSATLEAGPVAGFLGCESLEEDGPSVADGRVPLVLHLLAPNRRAVQVTTDLAGFWRHHYPEIRRDLERRYPKHRWPETPA